MKTFRISTSGGKETGKGKDPFNNRTFNVNIIKENKDWYLEQSTLKGYLGKALL